MTRTLKDIWEAICGGSFILILTILPFLKPKYQKWGSTDKELEKKKVIIPKTSAVLCAMGMLF